MPIRTSYPAPASGDALPGFGSPSASTEVPLEMLAACHDRVQTQCDTLLRLLPHLQRHGSDPQARQAAAAVMRYFDTAAPHHHADEEEDLFPALRESMAGSDAVCIRDLTESLMAEHRTLESRWRVLREPLQRVAAGEPRVIDAAKVEGFVAAYRAHIQREDKELLPMAARLLDPVALQRLGAAMRRRRGIADLP